MNSVFDRNDLDPGNGLCVAYLIISIPNVLPACTLRAAIEEANSLPGPDTIVLPAGTYQLDLAGAGEDHALTGDLDITDSVVLLGAGAENTFIDGRGLDRILDITRKNITVTVSGVSLRNGLLAVNRQSTEQGGGGVKNSGKLTVENSSLTGNHVQGEGSANTGGGISNNGRCTITNSIIENNSAGRGGGLTNLEGAVLNISGSTLSGNRAPEGGGILNSGDLKATNVTFSNNNLNPAGYSVGGAIQNRSTCSLIHCTIAENTAETGGGISNEGTLRMMNTLIAYNSGGNCRLISGLDSQGYNLVDDFSCKLDKTLNDIENKDPQLGPLQDNGGNTPTHALKLTSPAIDAGKFLQNVATDQRGVVRPQRRTSDIGAYELQPIAVPPFISPLLMK